MRRPGSISIALALAALTGGCSASNSPIASPGQSQIETGNLPGAQAPIETAVVVRGNATDAYTRVARGALACWLGTEGPLRATHIFHAEATPESQGGGAEIVLHERDTAATDQRGVRAFRVTFANAAGSVKVGIARLKIDAAAGELMAKDAEAWAKGGTGCQLRTLRRTPPPAPPKQVKR